MPEHLTGPSGEPVTPADLKAYLRITHDAEDTLLALLLTTARQMIESAVGRILLAQTWRLRWDAWPSSGLLLPPLAPVRRVIAAAVIGADGSSIEQPLDAFRLVGENGPLMCDLVRLARPSSASGGIRIDLELGYGETAAAVPAPLLQAVRQLAAHLYEARDADGPVMPPAVADLLGPYRRMRL